jgi:hypothetical protein
MPLPSAVLPVVSAAPVLPAPSSSPESVVPPSASKSPSKALPALSAAAEPPSRSEDFAARARTLNAFWDGFAPVPDSPLADFAVSGPGQELEAAGLAASVRAPESAPWLRAPDAKTAAALDAAVRLARSTRSGRKALDGAERALAGRQLPVRVRDLGRNYGEYDFTREEMFLHRGLFAKGRETDLAGTLIHELTHLAQHAQPLPSNALELEVEAHLADLRFMEELGAEPPPNTFARQAREALAKSPKAFTDLLELAVGGPFLGGGDSVKVLIGRLQEELEDLSLKDGPRARALEEIVARDLRLLRSRRGREAYAAFSKRVMAELARRSAEAKAARR